MTRMVNTPILVLDTEVAVRASQHLSSSLGAEVTLELLDGPGGYPVIRIFASVAMLGALATAIGEALDLLGLTPLDADDRREVNVLSAPLDPSSE